MLSNIVMMGGGKKIKEVFSGNAGPNAVSIMVMLIVLFLLRALVVQFAYNKIAPKLISNWGHDNKEFSPLTFEEALLFCNLNIFFVYLM